jgi:hypothetical protein
MCTIDLLTDNILQTSILCVYRPYLVSREVSSAQNDGGRSVHSR